MKAEALLKWIYMLFIPAAASCGVLRLKIKMYRFCQLGTHSNGSLGMAKLIRNWPSGFGENLFSLLS
jgi:hypothetical protein